MQQVEINVVEAKSGQRIMDVSADVKGRHSSPIATVMRPFADDDHIVADVAFAYPSPYGSLVVAVAINVGGVKGATSKGLVKKGQWNKFRLSVIGTTVALEINGKKAYKADGIADPEGYICLQAEVPGGGQFRFRNIRIAEPEK